MHKIIKHEVVGKKKQILNFRFTLPDKKNQDIWVFFRQQGEQTRFQKRRLYPISKFCARRFWRKGVITYFQERRLSPSAGKPPKSRQTSLWVFFRDSDILVFLPEKKNPNLWDSFPAKPRLFFSQLPCINRRAAI